MQGTQVLGQMFDAMVANSQILNLALNDERVIDRLVTGGQQAGQQAGQQIRVMYLGDMMNRGEADMLSQLVSSSNELSRNAVVARTVASNNQQIQAFMQRNSIARNRLVALDVIGRPVTLFVLGTSQGTSQGTDQGTDQGAQPTQRSGAQDRNAAPQASPSPRPRG